jgi:hypothetical protein
MTTSTIILVLILAVAFLGAAAALTSVVVRGDGLVGPGRAPTPPRSHYPDIFETMMRRSL